MNRRDAFIVGGASLATVLAYLLFRGSSQGDRIARAAEAHVGWGASQDATAFGQWLGGDGEEPSMCVSMATAPESSTCGFAVRAAERDAGIADPWLQPPYRPRMGHVIEDLLTYARSKGAWADATPGRVTLGRFPVRGSMVAIGDSSGVTHVYIVTSITVSADGTHATITSVDGGQTDAAGKQLIGTRDRVWTLQGATWVDSPAGAIQRIVYGWTDPELL